MYKTCCFLVTLVLVLLLAAPPPAHSLTPEEIEALRDELRRNIQGSAAFINTLSGVINATVSPDLSSAHFKISNPDDTETPFSTIKLPWRHYFKLEGKEWSPYLGGVIGYLSSDEDYVAVSPTFGRLIDMDIHWQALSAMAEGGIKYPLGRGFYAAPGLGLGYAYLRNRADFNNQFSQEVVQPVVDGLTSNYELNAFLVSGVAALGWEGRWGDLDLKAVLKYAHDFIQTFAVAEGAHRFNDQTDTIVARAELGGPLRLKLLGNPLSWQVFTGGLLLAGPGDGEVGFHHYIEIGGGLGLDISGWKQPLRKISLSGSLIFGDHLTGWSVSFGYSF